MSSLTGGELAILGHTLPTDPLILWAHQQLNCARGKEQGLQCLGISGQNVAELRSLLGKVESIQPYLPEGEVASLKGRLYELTCTLARALRLEKFRGPFGVAATGSPRRTRLARGLFAR